MSLFSFYNFPKVNREVEIAQKVSEWLLKTTVVTAPLGKVDDQLLDGLTVDYAALTDSNDQVVAVAEYVICGKAYIILKTYFSVVDAINIDTYREVFLHRFIRMCTDMRMAELYAPHYATLGMNNFTVMAGNPWDKSCSPTIEVETLPNMKPTVFRNLDFLGSRL